ncbi:MAG: ABC transporter ATP-binding protein [Gammaproteobacteria bacterium]
MNRLTVSDLTLSYGKTTVVTGASFSIEDGEIGCLLGPSGCGKTTLLLAIAGFQDPQQGEIILNDTVIASTSISTPPEKRRVGMVFQDYALFPNMRVRDNIAFGLNSLSDNEALERTNQLLELIEMTDYADNFPHQLSGGQQQRVALARALAPKPDLLLLDEPFSNLDVELREQLAREVRYILKQESIPTILVTHDQHEAFAMADNVCVMNRGQIQQQGTPHALYNQPANSFVAGFIGEGVLIPATISAPQTAVTSFAEFTLAEQKALAPQTEVQLLIRPEHVSFSDTSTVQAKITDIVFRGSTSLYTLELADGSTLLSQQLGAANFQVNDPIAIDFISEPIVIIGHGG